ncbi:MAG: hypothetical protein L0Y72_20910 [Gemmataceae bacterium]|nr:hypothetical protein [Gemmataceae bacterium]MCI0741502.1 hypothetical protein [Gemmataceae bacterium]
MPPDKPPALANFLALNRTVAVVLVSVLLFGLGEELWRSFLPVYFNAQLKQTTAEVGSAAALPAATLWTVGLFACLLNLFEALCYVGGGQLTARLGDRGSLHLFGVLTVTGYVLFLAVPATWTTVLAALLILGWEPLSVPVTFTTVGGTVAEEKRGMAFALQSIQKRLPKLLGPALAGLVLGALVGTFGPEEGTRIGMHALVGIALGLAVISLLVQWRFMPHRQAPAAEVSFAEIFRRYPAPLKRLLLAEVFTRWCDWLIREFVVLYVILIQDAPLPTALAVAGFLFALQHLVALLTYLPIGRMTQAVGLQPFIGLTFCFFALFPLALASIPNADWLPFAFILYGLREIGEPARKALITTSLPQDIRARGVGLYWGLRSVAVCWASLVGAAIWLALGPKALLYVAFALGCVGAGIYFLLVYRQNIPSATSEPRTQ